VNTGLLKSNPIRLTESPLRMGTHGASGGDVGRRRRCSARVLKRATAPVSACGNVQNWGDSPGGGATGTGAANFDVETDERRVSKNGDSKKRRGLTGRCGNGEGRPASMLKRTKTEKKRRGRRGWEDRDITGAAA